MNVLQINNHEQIGGGSERVFQTTSKMLMKKGHNIATLSCGNRPFDDFKYSALLPLNGYIEQNPAKTAANVANFIYRPQTAKRLEQLAEEFKPDIAHLHIFYGQLSSSVLSTLRKLNIPCVMTVHEYRMLCPISTLYTPRQGVCERCASGQKRHAIALRCNRGSLVASALSAAESWARDRWFNYVDHIDHFLMVSRFCLDKHTEYLPAIRDKSSVLYNFIGDADLAADSSAVSSDSPYLYAGRLSQEKGLELLCEAFRERPGLQLRIAGEGPLAQQLRSRFSDDKNIRFLGKLQSTELKQELSNCKFSIVPSEWYENNPMSVLESFGLGTPVIGANIGGIPELVIPGSTGISFSPSEKASLLKALDEATSTSIATRNEWGRKALQLIRERHSEGVYYAQLMTTYSQVLRSGS